MSDITANINKLNDIAKQAGKIILSYYKSHGDVGHKLDNSPVTIADSQANDYIVEQLQLAFPRIPIVSEEGEHDAKGSETFFLVDPLDGTKGFIKGSGEFTVNIGLIHKKTPILGVIYVPTEDILYHSDGEKAYKNGTEIRCRPQPKNRLVVVASRSHLDAETNNYIEFLRIKNPDLEFLSTASSLKFCMVAEGKADIYPRFGRTMEWDTAAGHAILIAAGGSVKTPQGGIFEYAKNEVFENGNFIAQGLPAETPPAPEPLL